MKSLRNKVVLSGIVLLFALVATIGSTYAWFTVSNTVSVSSIEMNVTSDDSLLILVDNNYTYADDAATLDDADSYSQNLVQSNIVGTSGTKYYDLASWRLTPVTAASTPTTSNATDYTVLNAKALQKLSDIDTTTDRALTSTGVDGNSATGEYIDIQFWLLSQGAAIDVALQDLVVAATNSIGTKDAAIEAVRVAIWVETELDVAATGANATPDIFSYDDATLTGTGNDYAFAWTGTMRGYSATAALNSVVAGSQSTLQGLHSLYYNSTTSAANTGHYVGTTAGITGAATVAALQADTPTKINVRIYVEGWDAETTNAILGAVFNVSFKFSIKQ